MCGPLHFIGSLLVVERFGIKSSVAVVVALLGFPRKGLREGRKLELLHRRSSTWKPH